MHGQHELQGHLLHGQHEHWVKLLHGTLVQGRVKVVSFDEHSTSCLPVLLCFYRNIRGHGKEVYKQIAYFCIELTN